MTAEEQVLAAMTERERTSVEFLERLKIIEEACKVSLVEALYLARRQGQR
jgi:hypothetical protein